MHFDQIKNTCQKSVEVEVLSCRVRSIDPVYDGVIIPDVGASKVCVGRQQGSIHRGLGSSEIEKIYAFSIIIDGHLSTVKVPLWLLMSVSTKPGLT